MNKITALIASAALVSTVAVAHAGGPVLIPTEPQVAATTTDGGMATFGLLPLLLGGAAAIAIGAAVLGSDGGEGSH